MRNHTLPPVLRRFWIAIAALTAASALFTAGMTRLLHTRKPYGVYVLWDGDQWWDFRVFGERFASFRSSGFWALHHYPFTYPAPMGVAFALIYKLPHPLRVYLSLCVAVLAWGAWMLVRTLTARGVGFGVAVAFTLTVAATCWPVALLLGTGNCEGLAAMLLAAGIVAALRERWGWAGALIGVAGALKIFPLVLLALLLSRRRYREFVLGLAVAAAATSCSLAVLGPTLVEAQRQIAGGLLFVRDFYLLAVPPEPFLVDHSLFTWVKVAVALAGRALHPGPAWRALGEHALLARTLTAYLIAVTLAGVTLYFAKIRTLPMLNQIIALSVCAVLLPPLSVDYTLVNLLLPFGLLCLVAAERWRAGEELAGLDACFGCFAVLFTVATYWTIRYRFGSAPRTIALMVLLGVVLRHRLPLVLPFGTRGETA